MTMLDALTEQYGDAQRFEDALRCQVAVEALKSALHDATTLWGELECETKKKDFKSTTKLQGLIKLQGDTKTARAKYTEVLKATEAALEAEKRGLEEEGRKLQEEARASERQLGDFYYLQMGGSQMEAKP